MSHNTPNDLDPGAEKAGSLRSADTVPGEGHTKGPMKWQSRNRPAFPGNEPEWEDCYVSAGEDEPAAGFWAQCEYRKVPVKAQGGQP